MYKQINDMYMLRERFVIIGVTGRTGSGCTTAAKFLSNDKCDLSSSFADLPPKDQQELNIIKSFLDRHWNKFYHIQFRDIISTFILESKYTEAKIYLKDKFSVNLNDFEETYNEFYEKNKIIDDLAKGSIEGFYTTNKCINEDKVEKLINYIFNELPQFTNKLRDFLNKDKTFAKTHYEKPAPGDAIIVELDEMWHYLGSKKTSYGSGKLIVEKLESLLTGNVEEGIRVRYRN